MTRCSDCMLYIDWNFMGHKCVHGIEFEGSIYDIGIPPEYFYDSKGEVLPDAENTLRKISKG